MLTINRVLNSLENTSKALFEWLKNNLLKRNAHKYHLLVSFYENVYVRNC